MKIHNPSITGSLIVSGSNVKVDFTTVDNGVSGSLSGSFTGALQSKDITNALTRTTISGSTTSLSSSVAADVAANLVSITNNSSSVASDVAANLVSITNNSSSVAADVAANLVSITTNSSSFASRYTNQINQDLRTTASPTFVDATITGTLTAQEVHTEFESASIIFTSGSTIFGNSSDDIHNMTGSLNVSGAINLNDGNLIVTDNIGIGTTSPDAKLKVEESTNGANVEIKMRALTDGGGGRTFSFTADPDARTLAMGESGELVIKEGNVGIGTSAPSGSLNTSSDGEMVITFEADANNNGQENCYIKFLTDGETQEGIVGMDNNDSSTLFNGNTENAMVFGCRSNLPVVFATNNLERMQIAADGSVGIGTTNPGNLLTIHAGTSTDGDVTVLRLNNDETALADGDGVSMMFGLGTDFRDAGKIGVFASDNSHDQYNMRFSVRNTSNALSERMRIVGSSGRVGIGFAAPETHLQVSGSIGSKLGAGGQIQLIRKEATISDGDVLGMVQFGGEETDQQVGATVQAKCDATWATNDLPSRLEFLTTPDGAGDQVLRMTIKNTGRVGIGTDSPDGTLDVGNSSTAQMRVKSFSAGDAILDLVAGGANDSQIRFYEDTTFKWRLRQNAGGSDRIEIINASDVGVSLGYGGNTWGTQSDERIKENLIEITDATEKLNQLRCINYNYTFDKEREHLGLIAQEVQKFYPQIVSGDPLKEIEEVVNEDGIFERKNVMSIEYSSLIPVLVKSIQELTKRIEELENK